jgi:Putative methyltransferase.
MTFKTIELQVPEGAVDGDSLVFQVHGKDLELTIPQGSQPGDVLQIQVKVEDEDVKDDMDEEKENNEFVTTASNSSNVTKVLLHKSIGGGVCLDIYSSVPHDYAPLTSQMHDKTDTTEQEEEGSDGTCAMVWPAGLHLAKKLSSPKFEKYLQNVRNVVELGSGTGVCGIAFVATATGRLSKRKGEIKMLKLTLTDMPKATKLLEYNWNMNRHVFSSQISQDNVCVKPLIWGRRVDDLAGFGPVDMIIGSDLLYNTSIDIYHDLRRTIQGMDGTAHAKILLSVRWRKPEQERKFFEIMEEAGYDFELVLDEDDDDDKDDDVLALGCNLTWQEFGNPNSDRSNAFFTNTFVQIENVSKPLKDVTEDDMDLMSDEEYETFEKRFIQIYLGQRRI